MTEQHGEAVVSTCDNSTDNLFHVGLKASELEEIFSKQSAAIKADPTIRFERTVTYALVECDTALQRIPLDACSLGLRADVSEYDSEMLSEDFIFSLMLAAGTISRSWIDVPADSNIDPQVVLQEAEAQGMGVRIMLPNEKTTKDSVEQYIQLLERYSVAWLAIQGCNFTLSPLDGYLEYKFSVAMGHTPKNITSNPEMHALFTDNLPVNVMDYIKERLDGVIERELGGDDFFLNEVQLLGGALKLKEAELYNARRKMIEEELDSRTPVPNLIRATSAMTGLDIPDSAGMIYELKNAIHTVLDKYLIKADGENEDPTVKSQAQMDFANSLMSAVTAGFGGSDNIKAIWERIAQASQLKQVIDLDRGTAEPSAFAKAAGASINVDPRIAALATAEAVAMLGSVFQAGGAIDEIGLDRAKAVAEPVTVVPSSNIIARG